MRRTLGSSLWIVYGVDGRYEAAYISEFFKMCGFLVTEQEVAELGEGLDYEQILKEMDQYSHNLFLGIEDMEGREISQNVNVVPFDPMFLEAYQKNNFAVLQARLKSVVEGTLDFNSQGLSGLIQVFVCKKYCKLSFIKRYFCKEIGIEKKEWLHREFLDMFHCLKEWCSVGTEEAIFPYSLYARLLCAKKVNELCLKIGWNFSFDLGEMVQSCLSILDYMPEFPSAYVLAAAFCTLDASFRDNVIPFYQSALQSNAPHPALANVHYKLGRYYEGYRDDNKRANNAYESAILAAPNYTRALFKRGKRLLDERKYKSAIDVYDEIIKIFSVKRSHTKLFPVEYEYLCKCYLLIGIIYGDYWADDWNGRRYNQGAVDLVERELGASPFFKDFLDDNEGIYLDYLKNRINLKTYVLVEKYK